MKAKRRLDDRWRREAAYHLSMIGAALSTRATWDSRNAALWRRCADLLATGGQVLQQRRDPPPEWRPSFERIINQLRSGLADDLD